MDIYAKWEVTANRYIVPFDFLKSHEKKINERKAEIAALQQQVVSIRNEVASEEKEKEELRSQIVELKNQVVAQKNELYDLQQDKEKTKKQVKKLKESYERLDKVLTSSTRQVRSLPSSGYTPIVSLFDKYLISIDEEDFQELSKYYSLKIENEAFRKKKEQREEILQEIENKIRNANNELVQLREDLVKQRDYNYAHEVKLIKKEVSNYSNELQEIKRDIDGYLKKHKEKMRFEMMHELYQRFTACEDLSLRKLRENLDRVNLSELHENMCEDRKIVRNACLIKEEYILCNVQNMCEEFIQLNIYKLTREMKTLDWESVKSKIGVMIQVVESLL